MAHRHYADSVNPSVYVERVDVIIGFKLRIGMKYLILVDN